MGEAVGRFLFKYRGYLGVPFFLLALALAKFSPLFWLGLGVAAAGELVRALAAAQAGPTTRSKALEAPALVTEGLYAWTRNPIYWGNFLVGLGMALSSGLLWLAAVFVPLFWLEYYFIVLAEEEFLGRKFGREYEEYKKKVRRFAVIPRRTRFRFAGPGRVLRQERGTLLTLALYYLALSLKISPWPFFSSLWTR